MLFIDRISKLTTSIASFLNQYRAFSKLQFMTPLSPIISLSNSFLSTGVKSIELELESELGLELEPEIYSELDINKIDKILLPENEKKQLKVIEKMVYDFSMDIKIEPLETVTCLR